jgi:hypothetical protein
MAKNPLQIIAYPASAASVADPLLLTVRDKVAAILPAKVKGQILKGDNQGLLELLPVFGTSEAGESSIWVSFLSNWEYMGGIGRYVDDALSRWLVPGKTLAMIGAARLSFSFTTLPNHRFFFGSTLFEIDPVHDLEIVQRNLRRVFEEIRLNVLAVYRARYISSLKSISFDQKNTMIQQNINKILNVQETEADQSVFDQMQALLMKLGREDKVGQIQKTIAQMTQNRPKTFDRGMFTEMTYFTVLFKDQFASKRDAKHISRVIALHYLFKKMLLEEVRKSPTDRHINFKIYKTSVDHEPVLGLLLGINMIRENERVDKRFLLEAIRGCIPGVEPVKDAYLFDRRDKKVSLFYLEFHKPSFAAFIYREIDQLRERLIGEIKKRIESDVHPIFMPRNEEEVARNLILLSHELKYTRDLPQVSIHYEKQTESELCFSIMMARLLSPKSRGLREIILRGQSEIRFAIDEIREIGKLKKKIPKETAVLRATLDKTAFFRPDYSVDLLRARQRVAYELSRIMGEYRDFNGGMILKQEESLHSLRKQLGPMAKDQEFLLENYFYSIKPGIMQTVLPTSVINAGFQLLQKFKTSPDPIASQKAERFFILWAKDPSPDFRERVEITVEALKIPSFELTSSFLDLGRMRAIGYILRLESEDHAAKLQGAIETITDKMSKIG